jgi:hypothetical protein
LCFGEISEFFLFLIFFRVPAELAKRLEDWAASLGSDVDATFQYTCENSAKRQSSSTLTLDGTVSGMGEKGGRGSGTERE